MKYEFYVEEYKNDNAFKNTCKKCIHINGCINMIDYNFLLSGFVILNCSGGYNIDDILGN